MIHQTLELMKSPITIIFSMIFTKGLSTCLLLSHQLVLFLPLLVSLREPITVILGNACSRAVLNVQGGHLVYALDMEVVKGARNQGVTRALRARQLSAKLMEEAGDARCLDAPRALMVRQISVLLMEVGAGALI